MAFPNIGEIRDYAITILGTDFKDESLTYVRQFAKDEIETLCGKSKVDTVESTTNENELETRRFRTAHLKFAAAELLSKPKLRNSGVPQQETGANGEDKFVYQDYDKTKKQIADLRQEAIVILQPYLLTGTAESEGGTFEASHPVIGEVC